MLDILSESTDILLSNENIYDAIKKSISNIGDAIDLDLICISQNTLKKSNKFVELWPTLVKEIQ